MGSEEGSFQSLQAPRVVPRALTVFADPLARIFEDEDHSIGQSREIIVGHSSTARLLVVCFAAHEQVVRILSARTATRIERKDYEEGVKS
jgi:uncharacterized DUF497 family protein